MQVVQELSPELNIFLSGPAIMHTVPGRPYDIYNNGRIINLIDLKLFTWYVRRGHFSSHSLTYYPVLKVEKLANQVGPYCSPYFLTIRLLYIRLHYIMGGGGFLTRHANITSSYAFLTANGLPHELHQV